MEVKWTISCEKSLILGNHLVLNSFHETADFDNTESSFVVSADNADSCHLICKLLFKLDSFLFELISKVVVVVRTATLFFPAQFKNKENNLFQNFHENKRYNYIFILRKNPSLLRRNKYVILYVSYCKTWVRYSRKV